MSNVYAELKAKVPFKLKFKSKLSIPDRLSLSELNEKLKYIEQVCSTYGEVIPLNLKIYEENANGSLVIFSNEWGMKSGNQTNILSLVQFALNTYYPDTEEETKQLLIDKIESGLNQPSSPIFEVSKVKNKKETSNILDIVSTQDSCTEEITNLPLSNKVKSEKVSSTNSLKKELLKIVYVLGIVLLSVSISICTTIFLLSDVLNNQTVKVQSQSEELTTSITLPFTIHEEGQIEQEEVKLLSYMEVDNLAAIKGTTKPNKTIVFKNKEGEEIGKTKSNDNGQFEVQLISGAQLE